MRRKINKENFHSFGLQELLNQNVFKRQAFLLPAVVLLDDSFHCVMQVKGRVSN
jgi:hypothetical protein